MSHKVCRLLSSPVLYASFAEKYGHITKTLLDGKRRSGARKTKRLHHSKIKYPSAPSALFALQQGGFYTM